MPELLGPRTVSALARGLQLLSCFTPAHPELSASEMARISGLPQPTVWRMCQTLIDLGYLDLMPGRDTMRPGVRSLALGFAVLATQPLAQLAYPAMQSIAIRYEGAVSLGAPAELDMIYLQRCEGSSIVLAGMGTGSKVPMATSATGWAFLAGLQEKERQPRLDAIAESLPDRWPELHDRLAEAFEQYATDGYVTNLSMLHPQIHAVGVPILSADGRPHFSLSAGGIKQVFDKERLAEVAAHLKEMAAHLETLPASSDPSEDVPRSTSS